MLLGPVKMMHWHISDVDGLMQLQLLDARLFTSEAVTLAYTFHVTTTADRSTVQFVLGFGARYAEVFADERVLFTSSKMLSATTQMTCSLPAQFSGAVVVRVYGSSASELQLTTGSSADFTLQWESARPCSIVVGRKVRDFPKGRAAVAAGQPVCLRTLVGRGAPPVASFRIIVVGLVLLLMMWTLL